VDDLYFLLAAVEELHAHGYIWSKLLGGNEEQERMLQLWCSLPDRLASLPCLDVPYKSGMGHGGFLRFLVHAMPAETERETVLQVMKRCKLVFGNISPFVDRLLKEGQISEILAISRDFAESLLEELLAHADSQLVTGLALEDETVARVCLGENGPHLNKLTIAQLLVESDQLHLVLMPMLLCRWESKAIVRNALRGVAATRHLAFLLLLSLSLLSPARLEAEGGWLQSLMRGVQIRLDTHDRELALPAMLVAQSFARLVPTKEPLTFEVGEGPLAKELLHWSNFAYNRERMDAVANAWPWVDKEPFRVQAEEEKEGEDDDEYRTLTERAVEGQPLPPSPLTPFMTVTPADEVARNAKIRPPRFLRDALAYLRSEDHSKSELGLLSALELVPNAPMLLMDEIGKDLFGLTLVLSHPQDTDDKLFDDQRRELMSAVWQRTVYGSSQQAIGMLLGKGQFTVMQKMELLAASVTVLHSSSSRPREQARNTFVRMEAYERQLGLKKAALKEPEGKLLQNMVTCFYLPLVQSIRSSSHPMFSLSTDVLLLERLLLAYTYLLSLPESRHLPQYVSLSLALMNFIQPLLVRSDREPPRKIQVAVLEMLGSLLVGWPDSARGTELILEHMSLFQSVSAFALERCNSGTGDELAATAALVLALLEQRTQISTLVSAMDHSFSITKV